MVKKLVDMSAKLTQITRMKYGTAEYSLNEAKKEIDKALEKISTIRDEVGTIAEIKQVGRIDIGYLERYYSGSSYCRFDKTQRSKVDSAYTNAQKFLKEITECVESIHSSNLLAIENNKETRKKICDFMSTIGIGESYHVYELPTLKSRTKQNIKKEAGYKLDVTRCVPISDGYDEAKRSLKSAEERLSSEYKTLITAIDKAEAEEKKVEKEKESLMELARFQVKYETTGGWSEILNDIIFKDKYLYLAHYLLKNREDWSEGCSHARTGIDAFTVDGGEDQLINDEIWDAIENYGGDGREFRDLPNYSFDYLFTLVKDAKLLEDYNIVKEKVDY